MPLTEVAILSFTALITMVNPISVIPPFVTMTLGTSWRTRARVALIASMACVVVLTLFLLAGTYVFELFGITVPAFQIMGGIIFLTNALNTLVHDDRRAFDVGGTKRAEDKDLQKAELEPTSIAVVPLAIPMLSGPGAITSVMVLVNTYPRVEHKLAVITAIFAVGVVSYVVLIAAMPLSRIIGDRGRAVFAKVMALLLGAIGIQFIINGIRPIMLEVVKAN